jgi:uracil-DNA glycosylase
LLHNATLSVELGLPGAHTKRGWEALTDKIIIAIAEAESPRVFMLWGSHAQAKAPLLAERAGCLVLHSNHPSPLSAARGPLPFLGNGHFGAANRFLTERGVAPIDWRAG